MSARDVILQAIRANWIKNDTSPVSETDAILSALDAAGYAVVPRMPTDGMVKAALTYIKDDAPCANPHGVYNAMLTAAKETP